MRFGPIFRYGAGTMTFGMPCSRAAFALPLFSSLFLAACGGPPPETGATKTPAPATAKNDAPKLDRSDAAVKALFHEALEAFNGQDKKGE